MSQRQTALVQGSSSQPVTVLLVDDEASLREVLRFGLVADGFRVLEAGSGREALALMDSAPFRISIVVTDIVMSAMSGVELACEVERRAPGLPVLLITGCSDQAPERDGRPLPLLLKPFRVGELVRRIRQLVKGGSDAV